MGVALATSDSAKRKSVILGERNAQHHAPRAEVSGFARLAVLAENTLAVLRRSRPWLTQKGVLFHFFQPKSPK